MNRGCSIAFVAFATALPAFAEVSDKMPSIWQLWLQGGVIAVLLFALGRIRLWTAAIAVAVAFFIAFGSYDMVNDEHVGRAVRAEQGTPYVAAAYGSAALCIVAGAAAVVGALRARRSRRPKARQAE
jgi:hypothetical protein